MNRRSFIKSGLLWLATPPAIIAATPQQVLLLSKPPSAPAASGEPDLFQSNWNTAVAPETEWTSKTDTGTYLSLDTTVKYEGAKSMLLSHLGNTNAYVSKVLAPNVSELWIRFYLYITTNSGWLDYRGFQSLVTYISGGLAGLQFGLSTAGPGVLSYLTLSYKDDSGNWQDAGAQSLTIAADTWHEVKIHSKGGAASTGSLQAWWNGTSKWNLTSITYNTYALIDTMILGQLGDNTGGTNQTINYDLFRCRVDSSF